MNSVFILTEVYCGECPTIIGIFTSKELAEETKMDLIADLDDYEYYVEYYIKEHRLFSESF